MPRRTLLLLSILLLVGCNTAKEQGSGSGAGSGKLRFAVVPKGTSHEFWKSVHFGAEKAAQELGNVEVVWKGPIKESDTASQVEVVKNMITQQVDGICLAPNHSQGLVDVVNEADDEGIPVVIFDSGLGEGAGYVSYVATDNYQGGKLAAKQMAYAIGEKGNVILLRYRAGSESTEQREQGFLDGISEYPDITVVSSDQYGEENASSAKAKVEQLLQVHGQSLNGIFAVCEPNANGTLEALRNTGHDKTVKFIAFDPSDSLIDAMKDGSCSGIVLQDPVQMGYMAVKTMAAHLKGEAPEKFISTGEYVATAENMEEERYQTLLKPKLFGE
ncbi:MAG: substrate-binding domain-containing protein [Pirellulaceae bacterium]|nr:substrate-binding domain-containing protein [Planctomycetales bacterium]